MKIRAFCRVDRLMTLKGTKKKHFWLEQKKIKQQGVLLNVTLWNGKTLSSGHALTSPKNWLKRGKIFKIITQKMGLRNCVTISLKLGWKNNKKPSHFGLLSILYRLCSYDGIHRKITFQFLLIFVLIIKTFVVC